MKATLKNGKTVQIRIQHNHTPKEELDKSLLDGKRISPHWTEALVQFDGQEFLGISKCHAEDKFTRKVGVATSVARALKKANLSRAERSEVWDKIWNGKYNKVTQ